jgi:hypothetical protein
MKKGVVWAGVLVVLFIIIGLSFVPAEAQNAKNINLKATFRDLAGDMFRSDGSGPYINGVDGVKCYISSNGDLNFTTSGRRRVIINLSEDQRALGPYLPGHPYPYPTDSSYYSGPVDNLSLSTRQYFPRFPLNLQEMAPNLIANAATWFQYRPNKRYLATQTVKFYDDGWTGTNLYNPNAFGCVLLVSAHDTNDDGLNETWDLEPIQNLGANTNVAWVYADDGIHTYFGWFYIPFRLTFQRLK